jgi:hypothetical protein
MVQNDNSEERKWLKYKYSMLVNRIKTKPSYKNVVNHFKSVEEFVECWIGRVKWWLNPQIDRISNNPKLGYSPTNIQWLSAEQHRQKSHRERASLTDAQAKEAFYRAESTWALAEEYGTSQATIQKLKAGISYRWLLLRGD